MYGARDVLPLLEQDVEAEMMPPHMDLPPAQRPHKHFRFHNAADAAQRCALLLLYTWDAKLGAGVTLRRDDRIDDPTDDGDDLTDDGIPVPTLSRLRLKVRVCVCADRSDGSIPVRPLSRLEKVFPCD